MACADSLSGTPTGGVAGLPPPDELLAVDLFTAFLALVGVVLAALLALPDDVALCGVAVLEANFRFFSPLFDTETRKKI